MLPIIERPLFGVAGFVAAAGFVGMLCASPANATLFQTSYTFDVDYCSTGWPERRDRRSGDADAKRQE